MAEFDLDALLAEISPDQPCGEDVAYDVTFGDLERAAQGVAAQSMGDSVKPGKEPDWAEVMTRATALLSRSKDLRIAIYLTRAQLNTQGLAGLANGLGLLHGLLERYWDQVYPRLDPDDQNDPTLRVNTIATLCDPEAVLGPLRGAALVTSKAFGTVTYRDVAIASGALSPTNDTEAFESAAIDAAFQDGDLQALAATAEATQSAVEHLTKIDELLTERVGVKAAPNLEALQSQLRSIDRVLEENLEKRSELPTTEPRITAGEGQSGVSPGGTSGPIGSREDVVQALDRICDYYARHDISSPIPLLLQRARRLVDKDFMEIMQDIAPDGLSQAKQVTGADSE